MPSIKGTSVDVSLYEERLANRVYQHFIGSDVTGDPCSLREAARAVIAAALQNATSRIALMVWIQSKFAASELEPYATGPSVDLLGRVSPRPAFAFTRVVDFLTDDNDRLLDVMRRLDYNRVARYWIMTVPPPPK